MGLSTETNKYTPLVRSLDKLSPENGRWLLVVKDNSYMKEEDRDLSSMNEEFIGWDFSLNIRDSLNKVSERLYLYYSIWDDPDQGIRASALKKYFY